MWQKYRGPRQSRVSAALVLFKISMGLESSAEKGINQFKLPSAQFSQMHHQDEKDAHTKQHAERLDAEDPLRDLRNEFIIPTKADLKRKTLTKTSVCRDLHGQCPSN